MLTRKTYPAVLLFITLMTILHWVILVLNIPLLDKLPYWIFSLRPTPVALGWIVLAFFILTTSLYIRFNKAFRYSSKLIVIFIAGAALQFAFSFAKNQGIEGLRARILESGHAEFAVAACQEKLTFSKVISDYENITQVNQYEFLPSKPPGTFLFYIANRHIADNIFPTGWDCINKLTLFASIIWPLLTYLVIFCIFILSTRYIGKETALNACLLFICTPSITLITLHTDQVIYPAIGAMPFLLITLAFQKRSFLIACLSGVFYYIAIFFSFGLTIMGVFFLIPFGIYLKQSFSKNLRSALLLLFSTIAGALICLALMQTIFNYDIYTRYTHAMQHHLSWKGWENTLQVFLDANTTNLIEYATWISLPVSLIFVYGSIKSLYKICRHKKTYPIIIFNGVLIFAFILLLFIGKTKAETARLWLFLLPYICIVVAYTIKNMRSTFTDKNKFILIYILLLELISTSLILRYQDFF